MLEVSASKLLAFMFSCSCEDLLNRPLLIFPSTGSKALSSLSDVSGQTCSRVRSYLAWLAMVSITWKRNCNVMQGLWHDITQALLLVKIRHAGTNLSGVDLP